MVVSELFRFAKSARRPHTSFGINVIRVGSRDGVQVANQ
jgi:hypothetical protein